MKRFRGRMLLSAAALLAALCGCGRREQVKLTVWGSQASQEMLQEMADEFIRLHEKEADIEIALRVEDEDTAADNAVSNPEQLADVFSFAEDQTMRLIGAGVLMPIEQGAEEVIEANGGIDNSAVEAASKDGVLYAYPLTASNGYFMYYNADYFEPGDVTALDDMLRKAEQAGKYVSMDWSSGWYIYSFFGGAGMQIRLNEEENRNFCDWNRTEGEYRGVDVARAMLSIASSKAFLNTNDEGLRRGIESGEIVAGINGPWNAEFVKEQWGDSYRAIKLPTYTINGRQVQMASFAGYKLVGVKATTKEPEWARKFAEFITNEENQLKRFRVTGEGPSNVRAAQAAEVQQAPAVAALRDQAPYSVRQSIAGPFWTPATIFGTVMASGNPDGRDLQELLDELVAEASRQEK